MQDAGQARMAMSNELRRALEDKQLAVFYQPIVDMGNGVFRTALAHARCWRQHDPELTVNVNVSPA